MTYTKKIVLFILAFLINQRIVAQQLPLFTQYREYHSIINPAMVSSDFMLNTYRIGLGASSRMQWIGLKNFPSTQVLHGEWVLQPENNFTFVTGGHILQDRVGREGATSFNGRLAGYFSGNPKNEGFAAGLTAGLKQYRLDATNSQLTNPNDVLADIRLQKLYPDISVGIFGYRSLTDDEDNVLSGGMSIPQVFAADLTFESAKGKASLRRLPHYYATIGYYKFLSSESFIELSSWLRYIKNTPFQADFNLRYQIQEYLWIGAGYSTSQIAHAEIGFLIGKIRDWSGYDIKIGYGYDMPFNTYTPYFGATHELNITFLIE